MTSTLCSELIILLQPDCVLIDDHKPVFFVVGGGDIRSLIL